MHYLLQSILREHWDWEATGHWITSDCGAIDDIYKTHHYTSTGAEAAAVALNAGTDLDCGSVFPGYLGSSLDQNLTTTSALNQATLRRYASLVKLGYFDPMQDRTYGSLGWSDVGTLAAEALAQRAAVEGIVLLKNDQTLPLAANKKVALIGPYANATRQLQGNYYGTAKYLRTMIWGAENAGYEVTYVQGTEINTDSTAGFNDAVNAAKQADIVIYAGGIDNSIESEGHDRTTIDWPGNQLDLVQRLSQVGKPLVVVQFGGGQLDDSTILSNDGVGALLWAGYPSQAGGAAVFDILTGKETPAGRLPITQYPANYVDEVAMTDMALRPGNDSPGRTYRWYEDAVLPFGHGLHYTTFNVSWQKGNSGPYNADALAAHKSTGTPVDTAPFDTFTLAVTNTGEVTSDYVALVFLTTDNAGPTPYPVRTLVGYQRVKQIQPGETRNVDIDVTLGSVARTADNGDLVLYPGSYTLQVDVGDKYPTSSFQIVGNQEVLDQFPQPAK